MEFSASLFDQDKSLAQHKPVPGPQDTIRNDYKFIFILQQVLSMAWKSAIIHHSVEFAIWSRFQLNLSTHLGLFNRDEILAQRQHRLEPQDVVGNEVELIVILLSGWPQRMFERKAMNDVETHHDFILFLQSASGRALDTQRWSSSTQQADSTLCRTICCRWHRGKRSWTLSRLNTSSLYV